MAHPEGPWRQSAFDHRQHVKFAWTVLAESPDSGPSIIADEIRRFADVHAPGRYHETITQFWVRLMAHTRAAAGQDTDFQTHVTRYPILLDKTALTNTTRAVPSALPGPDRCSSNRTLCRCPLKSGPTRTRTGPPLPETATGRQAREAREARSCDGTPKRLQRELRTRLLTPPAKPKTRMPAASAG